MLIKDQLYALQSLEYGPGRFLKWVIKNPLKFNLEKKKKLVYTGKARTLLFISALIPLVLVVIMRTSAVWVLAGLTASLLAPWLYLIGALLIIKLYEIPNRIKTINDARKILSQNPNLVVIAVTGSYGKTTVKEMLKAILSKKYKVLSTPKSFNTLFGISQTIKDQLKPEHEIFVVEMGAYQKGEIAELCRMVKPKIGILTGISNQHLERFGTEENVTAAKYELIESLPDDGLAVFNLYSKPCCDLYQKTTTVKIGYSRIENPHGIVPDLWAQITNSSTFSSEFKIFQKDQLSARSPKGLPQSPTVREGRLILQEILTENFTLNIPAEHNISNALAAISVALYLNLDSDSIRQTFAEIKTPEHRLQIITNPDGTVIVDDAYSSNTDGARAAVNLVKKFTNKPKIIVTPGLVELGKAQFEENKNFGKLIAENFDYAIIVNKTNRQSLLSGLKESGWVEESTSSKEKTSSSVFAPIASKTLEDKKLIFTADNLEKATKEIIPHLVKPGSLILFENDLPDIYE